MTDATLAHGSPEAAASACPRIKLNELSQNSLCAVLVNARHHWSESCLPMLGPDFNLMHDEEAHATNGSMVSIRTGACPVTLMTSGTLVAPPFGLETRGCDCEVYSDKRRATAMSESL